MSARRFKWLLALAALVACVRFGVAVYKAPAAARGDFFASLPGAYVKTLNPTLWNNPELAGAYGYQREIYVYGPTQYLVLYPIVFLKSYAQIATALSAVYGVLLSLALLLVARLINQRHLNDAVLTVIGVALLFPPFYQGFIQREFEVVVFVCIVAATCLLVARKDGWAGAMLGVITWFKLWPIAFLGYLLVKRRFKAVAGFVFVSFLTLGAAQLLFGLDRFIILNPSSSATLYGRQFVLATLIPRPTASTFVSEAGPGNATGSGFCRNWSEAEQTAVGVQWAICRLNFSHPWVVAPIVFYGFCVFLGLAVMLGFLVLDRRDVAGDEDRRFIAIIEMSLVVILASLILSAHYYYFIYLTLPLSALMYRFGLRSQWLKLSCTIVCYAFLGAFLIPLTVITRLSGVDFWKYYVEHVLYFYGELILIGLLLWEYLAIGLAQARPAPVGIRPPQQLTGELAR